MLIDKSGQLEFGDPVSNNILITILLVKLSVFLINLTNLLYICKHFWYTIFNFIRLQPIGLMMTTHESWRNVGEKIRYLRKSSGLTMKQLARGCDLSANTISLVERSEVAPNIETLCKIANALGVSPSSLFLEICKPRVVLQRADNTGEEIDIAGQAFQILATAPQTISCMPVNQKSPKLSSEESSSRRHSILCLCGQVELELDGQTYFLNPGDSLAFNGDAFYRWRNTGEATGIAVLILPNDTTDR